MVDHDERTFRGFEKKNDKVSDNGKTCREDSKM